MLPTVLDTKNAKKSNFSSKKYERQSDPFKYSCYNKTPQI